MNLADTLRGLLRRWYIVVPGIVVAIAVSIGAWQVIKPDYVRTGTQLLLPGATSIPEAGNPYLYLGGLSQAADVLVTAMSSENVLNPILDGHPGAEIDVARDPATSGPMLLTTVTARSDAESEEILSAVVDQTESELDRLQDVDGITAGNRIGIKTITLDQQSTLQQKNRILGVAASALVVLLLTFVIASLVDGLSTRRRRRSSPSPVVDDESVDAQDAEGAFEGDESEEPHPFEQFETIGDEPSVEESIDAEAPEAPEPPEPADEPRDEVDRELADLPTSTGDPATSRRTR